MASFIALDGLGGELDDDGNPLSYEEKQAAKRRGDEFEVNRFSSIRYYQLRMIVIGCFDLPWLLILVVHNHFFTTMLSVFMVIVLIAGAWL
jgi:hypothetical protein